MSGPHHYFGWIDPRATHIIEKDKDENLYYRLASRQEIGNSLITMKFLKPVPDAFIFKLSDYNWVPGTAVDDKMRVAH